MKWTRRTWIELTAIVAMTAIVSILAILQYQWTEQISRTEQGRLRASLNDGVRDFNKEFSYDFQRLCENFSVSPDVAARTLESQVVEMYSNWARTTTAPGLLISLYIWRSSGPQAPYLELFDPTLDPNSQRFQETAWPEQFELLHHWIEQQAAQQVSMGDREAVYYPWTLVEGSPALVRPLFQTSSSRRDADAEIVPAGYLILRMSEEFLRRQYFPELVERHFGDAGTRSFGVVVHSAKAPSHAIYASDPALANSAAAPEAVVNLFNSVSEEARRRGRPPLQAVEATGPWQLVVQHPAGSLDVAVTVWRRRNLIISFTLLAVLAVSMGLIFSVARRAERLARSQIDFVTGVSHELCTPLAVINSAAENLVDGIVAEPGRIQEYGGLIRDQGHRLERMVDQVLLFAAERSGRAVYEARPVEVAPVVTQSLNASEAVLREAGFTVEKEIDTNLPLVAADPAALGRCLDNLLSNAMKYSSDKRWIAVQARVAQAEVQIRVQDKGMGIPPRDLPHVFEAFYRVQSVREGHTRGVGLGLYLVKRMMEAMGGHVSVISEPGQGSTFILHFPVLNRAEQRHSGTAEQTWKPEY